MTTKTTTLEERKAEVTVDLFLFAGKFGRDALDEVYRRASEWLDRDEPERHESVPDIERWGRGND